MLHRPERITPSIFSRNYATEKNAVTAINKVLMTGDSFIVALHPTNGRFSPIIICRSGNAFLYAGAGFTVTN